VGTKICHVYLVSTYENQPADMTNVSIYCSWQICTKHNHWPTTKHWYYNI
jgi:hypothetical protein